ncbi:ATP-binding cassette, subfamily F, uup [Sinomicrobium oceani]|uniref:ATP-binding cassette, subfamily F, uup n=1 Tax=Sinomicrobium oceani TaxID=1150368 RepID=A0A1K1MTX6_9FLAO|nr:ABC-F family ATP-binding cassette domain-containing protein [Sinomicrobium oceani]SFW26636.1 ATP-binding cassette, subfamily F, uup [Sinomicrobium oceani]
MNYLSVENISKSFGERVLFTDISFGINKDQKIAFIAKNGTGKTSLLQIITGKDIPDTGQIVSRNGIFIGFLPQEPDLNPKLTVEETIFASDNKVLKIIRAYEDALENPEDETVYQRAFEQMELHQAWDFETRYKQILSKLKLDDLSQKVSSLSGGQQKRLALATVLLNNPDLLILDEPTNHLDLEMIEWLESYFARENMTLFMVTHDRYFLERVCNEIVELEDGKLHTYKGNYSYYLEKKEARVDAEKASVDKAKNLYVKELDWMRRQPKARTSKSKSRIDDFHVIKEKAHQRRKDHRVQLEINMERLGSKIVEFHNVSKTYGEKQILQRFQYVFRKGERVGIIGKNGTGKSTFLNMLTGITTPDSGKIVIGETVKFGYYTQAGIEVKPEQKVIDVIREFGDFIPLAKGKQISAAQLLERFLFDRKKQYDFVEKLSGGELKRLYLCTVLIQNPNFLILDEPTNDLDIVTLNVLEEFLLDFPGCLIVVSHDRYFMDKIVDHLFVFKGEAEIEDFPGNYTDFRTYEDSAPPAENEVKSTAPAGSGKEKNTWRRDANKGLSYNEQKEYNRLERDIRKLEEEKSRIEGLFADETLEGERIDELSVKLRKVLSEIEDKTDRWLELSYKD